MSWVKIDDLFPDNLKIAPLSDAAFRAHVTAICYASRNLTDGFVPIKKAKEFAGKPRVVQELVPHLWEPCDGGYMVHDYLAYNANRETVLAERERAKQRMQAARSARVRPNNDGNSDNPTPTPIPNPNPEDRNTQRSTPTRQRSVNHDDRDRLDAVAARFATFGEVRPTTADDIEWSYREFGIELLEQAVHRASSGGYQGKPPWSYVESTAQRIQREGPDSERPQEPRRPVGRTGRSDASERAAARIGA